MKDDLTGLPEDARMARVESYLRLRVRTRNGGGDEITPEHLLKVFKCRDVPAQFTEVPVSKEATRRVQLPEHRGRVRYFAGLLQETVLRIKARELAAKIQRDQPDLTTKDTKCTK